MAVHVRVINKYGIGPTVEAFRNACGNARILHEIRKREFYEKPSDKRRRKIRKRERELERQKRKNNLRS